MKCLTNKVATHYYENCIKIFSFASELTIYCTCVVSRPHNEHEPVSRAG